ncbi:MAG: flagellar hook-length control protein FliK, partial [Pseudomonas sp.]
RAPLAAPRQDHAGSAPAHDPAHDPAPHPRDAAHARDGHAASERAHPLRREQPRAQPAGDQAAAAHARAPQARRTADKAPDGDKPHEDTLGQDATAAQPVDAPWPPAGLGGLENVLAASAGTAPQPAVNANGTAGSLPGSAAQAAPGAVQAALPGAAPGAATGVLAAPPGGTTAAPGTGDFAATIAATTIDQAAAKTVDTIAAAATGNADGAPTPEAAALFALHAAAPPNAARGDASLFDGSPTPMPHLHEGFDDALGARLNWLADQKVGHAHIKITPDGLGPVEVRLQLDGDKVQANFTSAHAEVRQALEQSIPRLREMLGQHGFQLAHADVGGNSPQGRQTGGRGESAGMPEGTAAADEITGVGVPAATLRRRGLLDAYA